MQLLSCFGVFSRRAERKDGCSPHEGRVDEMLGASRCSSSSSITSRPLTSGSSANCSATSKPPCASAGSQRSTSWCLRTDKLSSPHHADSTATTSARAAAGCDSSSCCTTQAEADIPGLLIHEKLGSGSYGTVYRGHFQAQQVAVKHTVLPCNNDPSVMWARSNAVQEAAVASTLVHPNIVKTYYHRVSSSSMHGDGYPGSWELFLVQELCYCDLGQLLKIGHFRCGSTGRPYIHAILQLMRDVACGLQYMHSKSMIHGDVNPRNILLKSCEVKPDSFLAYTAKLTDFGLTKVVPPGQDDVEGILHGTMFYTAPEVIKTGHMSYASDIYSWGVILWECITGCSPFVPATDPDVKTKYMRNPIFPLLAGDLDPLLQELVSSCVDSCPAKRPPWYVILHCMSKVVANELAATAKSACPSNSLVLQHPADYEI